MTTLSASKSRPVYPNVSFWVAGAQLSGSRGFAPIQKPRLYLTQYELTQLAALSVVISLREMHHAERDDYTERIEVTTSLSQRVILAGRGSAIRIKGLCANSEAPVIPYA